jgi:hypothetical protein
MSDAERQAKILDMRVQVRNQVADEAREHGENTEEESNKALFGYDRALFPRVPFPWEILPYDLSDRKSVV